MPVLGSELFDDEMLGTVGVLILVDEHIAEILLVELKHIGMVAEEDVGLDQQVVEVHSSCLETAVPVVPVDNVQQWALGTCIVGEQFLVRAIHAWRNQVVLRIRDLRLHAVGLVDFVVELHLLDDGLDQGAGVGLVVDGKVGAKTQTTRFAPEYAAEERVEGAHPESSGGCRANNLLDTLLHLGGCLLGKGQRDDVLWAISVG